jgi:hypothetical protein
MRHLTVRAPGLLAGNPKPRVYLLQHLHVLPHGEEDVKVIGIYSSRKAAQAAVDRLKHQPGFRDFPRVVNPETEERPEGFYMDEYAVDQDHWKEGYETL